MRVRVLLLLFFLPLVWGTARADGEPRWTAVGVKPAPANELEDLQSPLHPHERTVGAGEPVRIGEERFSFRESAAAGTWTWTRVDGHPKKDKRSRTGSFRVPGYLSLSIGADSPYVLRTRTGEGGLRLSSATGLRLTSGHGYAYIVDSDLDGVPGTEGDGYVAPGSRTVGPWTGQVWIVVGGRRYRRRADAEDGIWEIARIPLPHGQDRDHSQAWSLLQWRRQQCGCLPLEYALDLEDGMRKHAAYLAKHDDGAHVEDPKKSGYTPEGARAGQSCIIGHGDESMLSAMKMHLATMYHRTRPLQPGLVKSAMVFHEGTFLFDIFTHRGGPQKDALLVYPPHGMREVRARFHEQGEHPMPVKDVKGQGNRLGTAVNLFSEPLRVATTLAEKPTLTLVHGKRRAKAVEGHFHYPGQSPSERAGPSNRGNVAFVPAAPLRPRTRYRASARVLLPGGTAFTYAWWFETAKEVRRRRR